MDITWAVISWTVPSYIPVSYPIITYEIRYHVLDNCSYVTDNEEKELVTFIMNAAAVGYGYSRKQVIELVQDVVEQKGNHDIKVTHGWWDRIVYGKPNVS